MYNWITREKSRRTGEANAIFIMKRVRKAIRAVRAGPDRRMGLDLITSSMVTYPVAKIVRQDQVAGERVGERVVKVQHLEQLVPLDGVQVAIGERSDVCRRLADARLLPERVPEHVPFACVFFNRLPSLDPIKSRVSYSRNKVALLQQHEIYRSRPSRCQHFSLSLCSASL